MPRPGTDVDILDAAGQGGPSLNTGQAMFVGNSERGPTDTYTELGSMKKYGEVYGARTGGTLLYDAASAFFQEGGGTLYVSRNSGPTAATAQGAFGTGLTALADSPGAWGDALTVSAEAPATLSEELQASGKRLRAVGDPIVIVVKQGGTIVDRSPVVATREEARAWGDTSYFVDLSLAAGTDLPAVGTSVDLAGGVDDSAVSQTSVTDALARLPYALGPGQVAAPGLTSAGVFTALRQHCDVMMRCGLLDLADSADITVLAAAVQALYGTAGVRLCAALAPWVVYPSAVAPATVVVPYSGVQAGLIAKADAMGNPNQPAAGVNGVSRLALGLSQSYTDIQREALNDVGVTLAKMIYGSVRTYGGRTAAGPDDTNWLWFGNSRTVMAIAHQADAIAENYVLRPIDGRRKLFAALESDLRGMLLPYFNAGALYGDTPADAFDVDTGTTVNTIDTIKAGEIHAVIRVKTSPSAEWVQISIVKVPVEVALAA